MTQAGRGGAIGRGASYVGDYVIPQRPDRDQINPRRHPRPRADGQHATANPTKGTQTAVGKPHSIEDTARRPSIQAGPISLEAVLCA